jgi:hypothetical protein
MGGGCTENDGRPSLSESVEELAEQADSRGAARRAGDLRAVAEHLRAKEAMQVREDRGEIVDVRPAALGRHRRPPTAASRPRGRAQALGQRLRRLVTRWPPGQR